MKFGWAYASGLALIWLALCPTLAGIPDFIVQATPRIITVPTDFAKIQDAVNAAAPGDTVLVEPGTYTENVLITKSLNLTATSKGMAIIDASQTGPGINITQTNAVSVSGFTVQNPGSAYDAILVNSSYNVLVSNNSVSASTSTFGIFLQNSNTVTVRDNNSTMSQYGIYVFGGYANNIRGNTATGGRIAGIEVADSPGNLIVDNQLRNDNYGLEIRAGSNSNVLARNLIANCTTFGLNLDTANSNKVIENSVDFNKALSSTIGIHVQSSQGNQFYHNNVRNNTIQVFGATPGDLSGSSWDDGAALVRRGNFWSDYTGLDNGANGRVAGDGVGDTNIPYRGIDDYPLVTAWVSSPVKVTSNVQGLSGCPPLNATFSGSATGGVPPYSYTWNFGDGTTAPVQNATHVYSTKGSYFATLRVDDSTGLNSTDTVSLIAFGGSLIGHVDDDSNNPISNVNITSLAQPAGKGTLRTTTGASGFFAFGCLPPGPYTFQFTAVGFNTLKTSFNVGDSTINQVFTMTRPPSFFATYSPWIVGITAGVLAMVIVFLLLRRRKKHASPHDVSPIRAKP